MKLKHISIKDLPVRVTKKGKKRGRPSKSELAMSKLISYEIKKPANQKAIQKTLNDLFLYGAGIIEMEL